MKVLPLSALLFSSAAFAEPKDLEKPEVTPPQPQVFTSSKPVTCTTDPYDVVKKNFLESHGEVGFSCENKHQGKNDCSSLITSLLFRKSSHIW